MIVTKKVKSRLNLIKKCRNQGHSSRFLPLRFRLTLLLPYTPLEGLPPSVRTTRSSWCPVHRAIKIHSNISTQLLLNYQPDATNYRNWILGRRAHSHDIPHLRLFIPPVIRKWLSQASHCPGMQTQSAHSHQPEEAHPWICLLDSWCHIALPEPILLRSQLQVAFISLTLLISELRRMWAPLALTSDS